MNEELEIVGTAISLVIAGLIVTVVVAVLLVLA